MHALTSRLLSRCVFHYLGLEIPRNGVNVGFFQSRFCYFAHVSEPFLLFRSCIHSMWSECSGLRHWPRKGLMPASRQLSPACSLLM